MTADRNAKDDAFIHVTVKCPICTQESTQRYIKSKLFQPVEVENDLHVVTYKWESPRYEAIRPNFYHIWHCPKCHFSDEKEIFRGEDNSHGKLEMILDKYLVVSRSPDSVINKLGKHIDYTQEFLTLETALCAHLQAIFIQEMLSPNMRQYPRLARFYLRTAWLYREKAQWDMPEADIPEGFENYKEFFESLRDEWPNLPLDEKEAMDKAIECYQQDLDASGRIDDIRHEVAVMFLVCDLLKRVGRRDEALQYVRSIFQSATRKRESTRKALDASVNRNVSAKQIETMRTLISWLSNMIEKSKSVSDALQIDIFNEEYPRARVAILGMGSPTIQEVVVRLKEDGFHDFTIKRLALMLKKNAPLSEDANVAEEEEPQEEEETQGGFFSNLITKIVGDKKK